MKINIYITFLALIALLTYSCSKDQGNYDYVKVPQVEVKGIDPAGYSKIYLQDKIHIEPEITSEEGDSPDNFEYRWIATKDNAGSAALPDYRVDTVGKERVLDIMASLPPAAYNLTLRVTNKKNNLQVFKTTKLEISTLFSRAFYVLKDMGTYTEMDAHTPTGTVISNVIEKSLKRKLQGKPVSLGMIYQYSYINSATGANEFGNSLAVCTEGEMNIFRTSNMTLIYDHNSMFFGPVPTEKPLYMYPNLTGLGYLSDKGHYRSLQNGGSKASGKFSYPDLVDGKPISPNINTVWDYGFYFFDELNGRFLVVNPNNVVSGYQGSGKPDLPYDIPHKLIFFGRSNIAKDIRGYALFRDKDNPSKHYLYIMTLTFSSLANPIREVRVINPASKINQAKYFATNETQARVLYFVTPDNKMYMYDLETNVESLMPVDGIDSDAEITYIRQRYWTNTADLANNFNNLIIASYKNGKYKVGFYETLGGKTSGAPKRVLEGDGKVIQFQYAAPSMTSFSYPNYTNAF